MKGEQLDASDGFLVLDELALLLGLDRKEILASKGQKLVDLGIDSLQISTLQSWLSPRPSLLNLYNWTVESVLEAGHITRQLLPVTADLETSFKLLEMQESYFIGRYESEGFVPCQVYSEFDFDYLDIQAFNRSVAHVARKHAMLRAHLVDDHCQQVRSIEEFDSSFKGIPVEKRGEADLEKWRHECMSAFSREPDCFWKISATLLPDGSTRLHVLLDMIFLDASSTVLVIADLALVYNSITSGVALRHDTQNSLTFAEYCTAVRSSSASVESQAYWRDRIDLISGPPLLPRARHGSEDTKQRFRRSALSFSPSTWQSLKTKAQHLQITQSALVLAMFAEILRAYSEEANFTLTITTTNRQVGDKSFMHVVGDFTDIVLVSAEERPSFADRAEQVHAGLMNALDHKDMSGLKLMRLLRERRHEPSFSLPVVFTSLLGSEVMPFRSLNGSVPRLVFQRTSTPQVWLDHQVYEVESESGKELRINWDYDTAFYDQNSIELMAQDYRVLIERLASSEWGKESCSEVCLPADVRDLRHRVNATEKHFTGQLLLHERFEANAAQCPDNIALIADELQFTYKQLDRLADSTAALLQRNGVRPGDLVAIVMEKGWEQVVGVIGVLKAGAAYVPVNPSDPDQRIAAVLQQARHPVVLSQGVPMRRRHSWKSSPDQIVLEVTLETDVDELQVVRADPDSLAYLIFTS